jgi:hypothetical protein
MIRELLDTRIRPSVQVRTSWFDCVFQSRYSACNARRFADPYPPRRSQEDGGDIEYVKFENGVVYLRMQVPP